jgi:hypothetical protein
MHEASEIIQALGNGKKRINSKKTCGQSIKSDIIKQTRRI